MTVHDHHHHHHREREREHIHTHAYVPNTTATPPRRWPQTGGDYEGEALTPSGIRIRAGAHVLRCVHATPDSPRHAGNERRQPHDAGRGNHFTDWQTDRQCRRQGEILSWRHSRRTGLAVVVVVRLLSQVEGFVMGSLFCQLIPSYYTIVSNEGGTSVSPFFYLSWTACIDICQYHSDFSAVGLRHYGTILSQYTRILLSTSISTIPQKSSRKKGLSQITIPSAPEPGRPLKKKKKTASK